MYLIHFSPLHSYNSFHCHTIWCRYYYCCCCCVVACFFCDCFSLGSSHFIFALPLFAFSGSSCTPIIIQYPTNRILFSISFFWICSSLKKVECRILASILLHHFEDYTFHFVLATQKGFRFIDTLSLWIRWVFKYLCGWFFWFSRLKCQLSLSSPIRSEKSLNGTRFVI